MSARPRHSRTLSNSALNIDTAQSEDRTIEDALHSHDESYAKVEAIKASSSRLSDKAEITSKTHIQGMALEVALESIATQWFGYEPSFIADEQMTSPPAPETLIAFGRDIGLSVSLLEVDIDKIETGDCPCLFVDRQGRGLILVERRVDHSFLCITQIGVIDLSVQELRSDYSGVVFRIEPLSEFYAEDALNEDMPVDSVLKLIFATMLKRKKSALLHLAIASGISNLLLIAVPLFSMAVYDRVLPHMAYETLWALTIGIGITLIADLGLRQVRLRVADSVAADVSQVLQVKMFRCLVHGQMKDLPKTGGVMAQTVRDLETYCQIVPLIFLSLVVDVPFVILTTILLIGVAGSVALVPLIGGLIIAAVYYAAHLIGHSKLAPYLAMMRAQSNTMIETIEGIEAVKSAGAESRLLNRWERLADTVALGSHESRLSHGLAAQITITLSQFMTVAALVLGVYEISLNAITVGALSAATMLISRLIAPITQFVAQAQRLAQAKKTLEPIRQILNVKTERAGDKSSEDLRQISGQVDFINVSFAYPDAQNLSLDSITVSFRPGERVGIIGRVGSGKSTLLRLIARLQDPTQGVIRLDGSDIRQLSPRHVRRAITFMKQDVGLFDDTLRANLLFGVDRPDPALIDQAVTISGVSILASRSPEGFGMRVGPRGEKLSGGEKQAVGLARAMIKNPRLLLLDEPTASMDNTIERHIINGMKSWLGDRGLIIATHRAAMLDLVDRVILMHDGKILADGPKSEVLRKLSTQG